MHILCAVYMCYSRSVRNLEKRTYLNCVACARVTVEVQAEITVMFV